MTSHRRRENYSPQGSKQDLFWAVDILKSRIMSNKKWLTAFINSPFQSGKLSLLKSSFFDDDNDDDGGKDQEDCFRMLCRCLSVQLSVLASRAWWKTVRWLLELLAPLRCCRIWPWLMVRSDPRWLSPSSRGHTEHCDQEVRSCRQCCRSALVLWGFKTTHTHSEPAHGRQYNVSRHIKVCRCALPG